MKGSTGTTIVIAIGIACFIGGSLTKDVNAYVSNNNATTRKITFPSYEWIKKDADVNDVATPFSTLPSTEKLEKPKNFVLSVNASKIQTRPFTAENAPSIETKITDSSDFALKFTKMIDVDLTSDCSNKRIYVLKSTTPLYDYLNGDRVLDVIEYDNSNKFQRIKRVFNMFKRAKSIASDWTTGKLYWIEYVEEKEYAIKVTNKLFDKPEYVIQPTIVQSASSSVFVVGNIQVYPKKNEIFFLIGDDIWYTSNALNSMPHLLFPSIEKNIHTFRIAIDYALDKLYWKTDDNLKCVNISDSTRPLNPQSIDSQDIDFSYSVFSVFNNIYYWVVDMSRQKALYMENGNRSELVASRLNNKYKTLFKVFSPNCTCQSKQSEYFVLIYDTFTIRTRPYFAENTPLSEYEITYSSNFSSNEDEVGLSESTKEDEPEVAAYFFVFKFPNEIFTRPYFTKNIPSRKVSNPSNFSLRLSKKMYKNINLVSGCFDDKVYILKKLTDGLERKNVLDVFQYEENKEFRRIKQLYDMFNRAESIASDWTTGNIYWIEYINDNKFSIKVTNKFFNESNYVIPPFVGFLVSNIQVYPKQNKIFFFNNFQIWYTSTLPNSTPELLFNSALNGSLSNLVIDYAQDKLCWYSQTYLDCVYIGDSTRPLNEQDIDRQPKFRDSPQFAVFNNTYYWSKEVNEKKVLYMKNGNDISKVESYVRG